MKRHSESTTSNQKHFANIKHAMAFTNNPKITEKQNNRQEPKAINTQSTTNKQRSKHSNRIKTAKTRLNPTKNPQTQPKATQNNRNQLKAIKFKQKQSTINKTIAN